MKYFDNFFENNIIYFRRKFSAPWGILRGSCAKRFPLIPSIGFADA